MSGTTLERARAAGRGCAVGGLLVSTLWGCFPTPQSARIEPGLRIDASAVRIADQDRDEHAEGTDYLTTVGLVYGFGERIEIGVPVGYYFEDGLRRSSSRFDNARTVVVMPYFKAALLPSESKHRVAISAQTSWVLISNVGVHYSRDLGSWEPQAGLTWILSPGPAGDSPAVTRYQQAGQLLLAPTIGASWPLQGRPTLQAGLLINSYREGAVYGDFGQPTVRRTLLDLVVGFRVSVH